MAQKQPKWVTEPVKITKAALKGFEYSDAPDAPSTQIHWDTDLSNFGVRCYPSGKRSYVIGYRVNGKYIRTSIGSVDEYAAPNQAREVARDKLAGHCNHGLPRAETRALVRSLSSRCLAEPQRLPPVRRPA